MRRAFDSALLRRARDAGRIERELPLVVVDDDQISEGYLDLAFEPEPGAGWVIVDYKTDRRATPETLQRYEAQVGAYVRMFRRAGEAVAEAHLLLTATGESHPVPLP